MLSRAKTLDSRFHGNDVSVRNSLGSFQTAIGSQREASKKLNQQDNRRGFPIVIAAQAGIQCFVGFPGFRLARFILSAFDGVRLAIIVAKIS